MKFKDPYGFDAVYDDLYECGGGKTITVQEHDNIADLLHKFSVNDLDSVFATQGLYFDHE
ncbi:hypothetical protein AGMMS50233_06220 [Endomicrobiia bacterium]|nr:hypothetical protein AGMMS50233_06220 [Endomicrobiia bacterium]